jgi:hypothetical protein
VYERRAWTFQERLLSRRCVLLGIFVCGSHIQSSPPFIAEIPSAFAKGLFTSHKENTVVRANLLSRIYEMSAEESISIDSFALYGELVHAYSRRILTYPSDASNTFAGISSALEDAISCGFMWGLPEAALDVALLWTVDTQPASVNGYAPSSRQRQHQHQHLDVYIVPLIV